MQEARAGAREPAGGDDDGLEDERHTLVRKAQKVLGRHLELGELQMLRGWVREVPITLIEEALADGKRRGIRRLAWVGKRLETLLEGYLAQHPELRDDDVEEERADALRALDNDQIAGHLPDAWRHEARQAIRVAKTARQVRDILDGALDP